MVAETIQQPSIVNCSHDDEVAFPMVGWLFLFFLDERGGGSRTHVSKICTTCGRYGIWARLYQGRPSETDVIPTACLFRSSTAWAFILRAPVSFLFFFLVDRNLSPAGSYLIFLSAQEITKWICGFLSTSQWWVVSIMTSPWLNDFGCFFFVPELTFS